MYRSARAEMRKLHRKTAFHKLAYTAIAGKINNAAR